MKKVTNESLQGLMVYFVTESGSKGFWFAPGQSLVVPENYVSDHVQKLQQRRMLAVEAA